MGIRLAEFVVEVAAPGRRRRADRRHGGPDAHKIRSADGFVVVTGEYNWGVQPGPKNLTDHFLGRMVLETCRDRELFGRPSVRSARGNRQARHAVRDGMASLIRGPSRVALTIWYPRLNC
jgi:hypothetical protein